MKKAFTMLELVFVIVVVGILSYFAASSFQRNPLREAADQVVSHIRYTQHLAMQDDRFITTDRQWFKERWQIVFGRALNGQDLWPYTVFSDNSNRDTNPNMEREIARDPINSGTLNALGQMVANSGHYLSGGSNGVLNFGNNRISTKMQLNSAYGIQSVLFSLTCSNNQGANQSRRIIFDNMGRPYWTYNRQANAPLEKNPYADMTLIRARCAIDLCLTNPCPAGVNSNKITIVIEPETGYTYIQ